MKKHTLPNLILSLLVPLGCLTNLIAQSDGMGNMPGMQGDAGHHMAAHMKMTARRLPQPGDVAKAQQVVEAARKVCEKYQDYKVALAEGFHIFRPNEPHTVYHFSNSDYAREAAEHFNPEHPTSLLYTKEGDSYKLVGVMYTAPKWSSEDELNERIPLSIAQWHQHVNLCLSPANAPQHDARFGPNGSISTRAECESAGGRFIPEIFGWMVHVYPFEANPYDLALFDRQMKDED